MGINVYTIARPKKRWVLDVFYPTKDKLFTIFNIEWEVSNSGFIHTGWVMSFELMVLGFGFHAAVLLKEEEQDDD